MQVANICVVFGTVTVLTKQFWANHFIMEMYLYSNVTGVVVSVVSFMGCVEVYLAEASYEEWLEAQPPEMQDKHRADQQSILHFINVFYWLSV